MTSSVAQDNQQPSKPLCVMPTPEQLGLTPEQVKQIAEESALTMQRLKAKHRVETTETDTDLITTTYDITTGRKLLVMRTPKSR